ncbi:MAG: hypothetical protein JNL38_13580 [Myxococcales bacterium]|jgi:hypothetical protein|nr:hypothetical protein [Myxococcales bacterium]
MSMKRTKQRSFGRDKDEDSASPFFKAPEPEKTFEQLVEGTSESDFGPYDMSLKYDKGHRLSHPKFGRGFVVGVEGTRIEILFADGKRKLGHGTQPPPMRPQDEIDAERAARAEAEATAKAAAAAAKAEADAAKAAAAAAKAEADAAKAAAAEAKAAAAAAKAEADADAAKEVAAAAIEAAPGAATASEGATS